MTGCLRAGHPVSGDVIFVAARVCPYFLKHNTCRSYFLVVCNDFTLSLDFISREAVAFKSILRGVFLLKSHSFSRWILPKFITFIHQLCLHLLPNSNRIQYYNGRWTMWRISVLETKKKKKMCIDKTAYASVFKWPKPVVIRMMERFSAIKIMNLLEAKSASLIL